MNVEFINPFLHSITNILNTMATLNVEHGSISLKNHNTPLGDVTGIICMSSPQTQGTLAISFSAPVIIDITQRMLNEKVSAIDETVTDLVGELTNMVSGSAKRLLDEKGYDFDMATPEVFSGKDKVIAHQENTAVIIIPLKAESGDLFVEICFEKNAA